MVDKVKKQLRPGRPRTAVNKSELPKSPTQPKVPKVPKASTGELAKEIIGSHMGMLLPASAPAIKNPVKPSPRPKKAPPF